MKYLSNRSNKTYENKPSEIIIELTKDCNFNCDFCFNRNDNESNPSKEEIFQILDEISSSGIKAVRFTGGEPFLREDLEEILAKAKEHNLYVILNTNAFLINRDNKHLFQYVDLTLFSLHYTSGFGRIKNAMELLENEKTEIMIGTIALRENIEKLEEYYDFISKIKQKNFKTWFLLRPIPNHENDFPLQRKDIEKLYDEMVDLNDKYNMDVRIANSVPFCAVKRNLQNICIGGKFDSGHSRLFIDSKGDIKTDCFSQKISNIKNESIMKVWNRKELKDIRGNKYLKDECKKCYFKEKCKGGLLKNEYLREPNNLKSKKKIMFITSVRSHPCFLGLEREIKKNHLFKKAYVNFSEHNRVKEKGNKLEIYYNNTIYDQRYDKNLARLFFKIFLRYKPDIIHIQSFSGLSLLSILRSAQNLGVKCIITLHDHSLFCVKGTLNDGKENCEINKLEDCKCNNLDNKKRKERAERIIGMCDKIICPSEHQKRQLTKLFGENSKFTALYYGIKLRKDTPPKENNKITFGYAGTVSEIKGIEKIIKALENLKGLDFKLLMAIKPQNVPNENKKIKELERNEKIEVLRDVNMEERRDKFYSRIDYLIIPSIWNETGPMVLFESLDCNIPVIISNQESMIEKIRGCKNCRIFNNSEELGEIMKEIIINKDKKRENCKVKEAKDYYEEVHDIYDNVLKKDRKSLFLKVGYECNNDCKFCVIGGSTPKEFVEGKTIKKTLLEKRNEYNGVVLTGGEPTIRNDFLEIINFANKLGYKILLQTNGRMLKDKKLCEELKGKIKASINLNSYSQETHDIMAGVKGSFEETVEGIKNLTNLNIPILGKFLLTRENYKDIHKTIGFMRELGIKEIWIVFLTPAGYAKQNFEKNTPSYSEVKPWVDEALNKFKDMDIKLEGFPYCLIKPKFRERVTEESLSKEDLRGIHPDLTNYDCKYERVNNQKTKFDFCQKCDFNHICEGVYKEYVNKRGKEEFKPVKNESD